MKITPKTITLTIESTLSPMGMIEHAAMLRVLAETCPSVAHAATYRSMADAFEAQVEAIAQAEREQAAHERRCLVLDSRNGFMVAAGKAFRLSTPEGEDAKIPTSREMAKQCKEVGTFERSKWNGSTWIVVPAHWRARAVAAEAASKAA